MLTYFHLSNNLTMGQPMRGGRVCMIEHALLPIKITDLKQIQCSPVMCPS